jgi:hypothetical protein
MAACSSVVSTLDFYLQFCVGTLEVKGNRRLIEKSGSRWQIAFFSPLSRVPTLIYRRARAMPLFVFARGAAQITNGSPIIAMCVEKGQFLHNSLGGATVRF